MKFTNRMPAAYFKSLSKRVKVVKLGSPAENNILSVPKKEVALPRKYNSLTHKTSLDKHPSCHSFSPDKDLVFRRLLSATSTDVVLDFPQLLTALPTEAKESEVFTFPLLNPWRLNKSFAQLPDSEKEVQKKRQDFLNSCFPASNFPSVTRVLSATMSEASISSLEKWKEKMKEELGEVGFVQHQRQLFHRGSLLHRHIAHFLTEGQFLDSIPSEIEGLWKSLTSVFPDIEKVKLLEKHITHPFLCYKGVADCVASYKNEMVVIDWKTSSKQKPSMNELYDEPIQAAAYAGALNYDRNLDLQVDKFAVVIAYESGEPAHVHAFNHTICKDYWGLWLKRLKQYWRQLEKK